MKKVFMLDTRSSPNSPPPNLFAPPQKIIEIYKLWKGIFCFYSLLFSISFYLFPFSHFFIPFLNLLFESLGGGAFAPNNLVEAAPFALPPEYAPDPE